MASNYKNNGNGTYTFYEGSYTVVRDINGNIISKTYIDAGGTKRTEHYSNGKHMSTTSTSRNGQTLTSESADAMSERLRIARERERKTGTSLGYANLSSHTTKSSSTPRGTCRPTTSGFFLDSLRGKKK